MNTLVKIGRAESVQRSPSFLERLSRGPLVDKFFAIAFLSGFFGSSYLGAHMWLILNGQMAAWTYYVEIRAFHAVLQSFAFIGLFIVGFVLQAAPKLFGVDKIVSRYLLFLPISILTGCVLTFSYPNSLIGESIISLSFLMALFALLPFLRETGREQLLAPGVLLVVSLLVFVAAPFLQVEQFTPALIVFWGGVGGAIFATAQNFLLGFFGGRKMSSPTGAIFLLVYGASLASGTSAMVSTEGSELWIRCFGALVVLSLILYGVFTGALRARAKLLSDPLAFGFCCSWFWAICGGLLLVSGGGSSDYALHVWATGWATTLIIAVSCRILGFLSGRPLLQDRALILLLALWQIVPILRGMPLGRDPLLSWILISVVSIVFLVWGWGLLGAVFRLTQRQFGQVGNRKMVQC